MAYPIGANSILEIQIVGRLDGQTTRNVFHYWYPTGSDGITDGEQAASDFAADFSGNVYVALTSLICTSWNLQYIQSQWIQPTRWRAVQQSATDLGVPQTGVIATACTPSGAAVVVSKYSEHAGHSFQGRNYFAGIPVSSLTNSVLNSLAQGNWDLFALTLLDTIVTSIGDAAVPVVIAQGAAGSTDHIVSTVTAQDTVRYQRRREVGQGE